MVLLVAFAVIAGAGTAVTPCVLPVLPAVLSAGATGGRRRPLGIILGLTTTFTVTIVGLASLIHGVGLADGFVRTVAVVVLVAFGLALVWPRLGDLVERPLTRLARFGPRGAGDGFRSGLLVGAALGFVYAPCAGPILAAVVSVAATMGASFKLVVIALARGREPARKAARPPALPSGGGQRLGAARPGHGAGLRRYRPLVQQPTVEHRGAPRTRRPDRLLDIHVHQLPAHAPLRAGLVPALPPGRAGDRRRPHAGVRLRARDIQRGPRREQQPPDLPRRPGQQLRDLGRLGQPVLAGPLPDRRPRAGPLHALRRG